MVIDVKAVNEPEKVRWMHFLNDPDKNAQSLSDVTEFSYSMKLKRVIFGTESQHNAPGLRPVNQHKLYNP